MPRPAAAITKRKLRPIPSDIQEVRVIIARSAVTGAVVATLETDPDGSRYCVAFTDLEEILLVDVFAYCTEITLPADLEPRCLVEEEEEEEEECRCSWRNSFPLGGVVTTDMRRGKVLYKGLAYVADVVSRHKAPSLNEDLQKAVKKVRQFYRGIAMGLPSPGFQKSLLQEDCHH